jgi:NAD(P)-dependent dehydrogenase (short-subunit alcohol dehydrogenase family)
VSKIEYVCSRKRTCRFHLRNLVVIITGPSHGGIGAATAISLAAGEPRQLILLSRKLSTVQPVIDEIQLKYSKLPVSFVQCDLSSQASIRKAVGEIDGLVEQIDVLINNAAITPGPYSKTAEGIECQFGVDHVGHFLLTNLLMPKILAAKSGARVVNVSSSAHRYSTPLSADYSFEDGATYTELKGYAQAKAANILFTRSLARRLKRHDMQSFTLHPGGINTGMSSQVSQEALAKALQARKEAAAKEGREFKQREKKTLEQGCATTLVAALDPSIVEQSGAYLEDGNISQTVLPGHVLDDEEAEKLWKLSEKLVCEEFGCS